MIIYRNFTADNYAQTCQKNSYIRRKYITLGYEPIPCRGKVPAVKHWQDICVDADRVIAWSEDYSDAFNTGIRTRYCPAIDIDVYDGEMVKKIRQKISDFVPAGTSLERTGQLPKVLIPFHSDVPFDKIATSFKSPDGKVHKVEVLCDGQQFIADGIHPDTGKPYQWKNNTDLSSVARNQLPLMDVALAHQIIDCAANVMREAGWTEVDTRGKIKAPKTNGSKSPWAQAALDGECEKVRNAASGMRNDTLNAAAFSLGQIIGAGELGWGEVEQLLTQAARGLVDDDGESSVKSTITSGITAGMEKPRGTPNNDNAVPQTKSFPAKCSLDDVHQVFRKWLGEEYDLGALDAMLATIASEQLTGDPLWLLIIGGPGVAKTETVQAGAGAGGHVTSTIASEGALLSATSTKTRSKAATGGLLRKIGDRGLLIIKDVTSILSADRNVRAQVLAALREIYDGRWERNVGTDGGQTLTWVGHLTIIGAVTTAWDAAHSVVASMGDRFVSIRVDSKSQITRKSSGMKSIRNTGAEKQMRDELANAVGGVVAGMNIADVALSDDENEQLLNAANIVTMARTAVERDYRGEVIDCHAPEMPTRFLKQLAQIIRGGVAIGMTREQAMKLAIRCARDSIPPLRLEILLDIAIHPRSQTGHVRKRISKPWSTIKRELEALHMLGMLRCDEEETTTKTFQEKIIFRYSLADDFDRATLLAMVGTPPSPDM